MPSTFTEVEIAAAIRKNKARMNREWSARNTKIEKPWIIRLRDLERKLLRSSPHLKDQKVCGLISHEIVPEAA